MAKDKVKKVSKKLKLPVVITKYNNKYFKVNYNSYDNQEQVAISLVQDFNKTREKENKHNNVISILAIIIIIILSRGIIRKVKNCKKVKKRKGEINSMSGTRRRKNRRR